MKKKLIYRIGAFVCAMVVAVSCLVGSGLYYADINYSYYLYMNRALGYDNSITVDEIGLNNTILSYDYWAVFVQNDYSFFYAICSNEPFELASPGISNLAFCGSYMDSSVVSLYKKNGDSSWKTTNLSSYSILECSVDETGNVSVSEGYAKYVGSNFDLCYDGYTFFTPSEIGDVGDGGSYNSNLGYLQNIYRQNLYLRGGVSIGGVELPLYYDDALDTLKRVWTYDLTTSSGVDLSSGNYSIRHYVKEATVKGYDEADIVEMSDMYLMGEYEANGRFEYMETEHEEKLSSLGYDGLSWIDKYLNGYFQLEHHYFQIVNLDTNEVGGYLHVYPKNEDGELGLEVYGNEGVELGYEGLDEDLEVVPDAPSGEVGESVGHGDTYEDAEEQAEEVQLNIEGIEHFVSSVESYASQIGNVTQGIGSLLSVLPPWIVGILGLGVCLVCVLWLIKTIRG